MLRLITYTFNKFQWFRNGSYFWSRFPNPWVSWSRTFRRTYLQIATSTQLMWKERKEDKAAKSTNYFIFFYENTTCIFMLMISIDFNIRNYFYLPPLFLSTQAVGNSTMTRQMPKGNTRPLLILYKKIYSIRAILWEVWKKPPNIM